MKKIILKLVFFSIPITLFAQQDMGVDETEKTNTYEFFKSVVAYPCNNPNCDDVDTANPISVDVGRLKSGAIAFAHEHTNGDTIVVRFLPFKSPEFRHKYNYEYDSLSKIESVKYFCVKKDDFKEKSRRIYTTKLFRGGSAITGGVVLLPIKIRPKTPNSITGQNGGFDFSKDITLGLSIGHKQRVSVRKPYFLNLLFCTGIGSIGLDSFNTEGTITSSEDVPAWTIATGFVMDYKAIQFGAFVGWDHLSSKNRNNWIYQGKIWYSIGIGYSLFSVSSAPSKSAHSQ